jgi:hypothetical protein
VALTLFPELANPHALRFPLAGNRRQLALCQRSVQSVSMSAVEQPVLPVTLKQPHQTVQHQLQPLVSHVLETLSLALIKATASHVLRATIAAAAPSVLHALLARFQFSVLVVALILVPETSLLQPN